MKHPHLLRLLVAALVVTGAASLVADPPPSTTLPWVELVLDGRKLGVAASIKVRSVLIPSAQTAGAWLPTAAATVVRPGGPEVLLVESQTRLAGRLFDERLWIDPASRAAIQIDDTETGARNHRRVYRLLAGGFIYEQREPASGEEATPPPGWTKLQRSASKFPASLATGAVVTGALALVGGDVLAGLRVPGDHVSCLVLVQNQIEEVTIAVESAGPAPVAFSEHRADGDHQVSGTLDALFLTVTSRSIDQDARAAFRLFGLDHGVRVVWEPVRKIPLQIVGQVHLFGQVTISLEEIRY